MLAKANTENLKTAINKVLSVVDKRNSRPILAYTLFETTQDGIFISATDLEVSAKVHLPANVEKEGSFCVNAKNLFDILKELPTSEILLEISDDLNSLHLTCNNIHYTLLIYKNNDFPHLVFEGDENTINISSNHILEVINKTSHCISSDETRLHLNGVFIQEIDSKLRAVATDGHRLALVDIDMEPSNSESLSNGVIIPKKGVFELKKIAESTLDGTIRISVDDSFIYASSEDKYFLSVRLIAREYPKYQAVIPTKTSFVLRSEKDIFLNAARRIKIMSNEKSNGIKVLLSENELTIMANHPSLGDAKETLNVDYQGKEMEIGFNAKYLIEALSIFEEGEISLEFNNELSPVIIKSDSLSNFLGIIMPLKL